MVGCHSFQHRGYGPEHHDDWHEHHDHEHGHDEHHHGIGGHSHAPKKTANACALRSDHVV